MASISFTEVEIKKLILALAGSKATPESPEMDEAKETPEHEAKPSDPAEDKAEGEQPDTEDSSGKPHESSTEMLARKLKEKGSK